MARKLAGSIPLLSTLLFCLLIPGSGRSASAPFYVDLTGAANTALLDDGIANNGQGGWSDEGVNDMFLYPPLPSGEVIRNGYHFKLIDPAANGGKAVIMLRGRGSLANKPDQVIVEVPQVKGRFLYFVQNSVGSAAGLPPNDAAAVYTLHFADGSTGEIPVHDGVEIRHWWTGQWYDNSGAKSWPVFMGRNPYSIKWNQYIGVWAMQWENPSPEKPITSITFRSQGQAAPAIFAVTITDEDYFNSPHLKDDYKRPPDVPPDFFRSRLSREQELLFAEMVKRKMIQGIRGVEVLRPDLLALTLDAIVSGGAGQADAEAAALQQPGRFTITSAADAVGIHPQKVGRETFLYDTVDIGPFPSNNIFWHTYFLQLPAPLQNGRRYQIAVEGLKQGFKNRVELDFDDQRTVTPAIKVNQAAYFLKSARRYAYLGCWAGDLGTVDYGRFKQFQVIDDHTGQPVYQGAITLRKAGDEASGEDVYQMDLSPLKTPGRYHIRAPGLGRSFSFGLGSTHDLYTVSMRGFWYQRCGQGRTAAGDYPHPACHLLNYRNGHLVGGAEERYQDGKLIPAPVAHAPDEPVKEFRGGYHDAGDYDVFYYHLRATARILTAYEKFPRAFQDGDLRLPESGSRIPDLLDEAAWGLKFYIDNQQQDGGIFAGRANDEDYGRKEWKEEWAKEFGDLPPYGNFPPCSPSSSAFAAVAAQYSRLVRPFDARQADRFLQAAKKAYAWARDHHNTLYEKLGPSYGRLEWPKGLAWAAAELFETTGEEPYSTQFVELFREGDAFKADWKTVNELPTYWWPYAASHRPNADKEIQARLRESILKAADQVVADTEKFPYRMGAEHQEGGWGNLVGGGYYGDTCLMAYFLTGQQQYLDAASLNADYQLGANPLSRCFITGLGARPPQHPELRAPLYDDQGLPAPGIPVFGPGGSPDSMAGYPPRPPWRTWQDNHIDALHSEFTIESIGYSAMLYGSLWGLEGPTPLVR